MEIRLGYVEQFEDGYTTFLDKKLTIDEYSDYSKAIIEIQVYENLKRLFQIITLNNNEFIEFTERGSKTLFENLSVVGNKDNYYNHHLHLNRILLNYLSSFRSLIDHIETIIKRKYGQKSKEAEKYEEIVKDVFDTYFAYRFLYKLRNYSQHCRLPIDEFEISATKIGENKFRPGYKIEFETKLLLENYDGWGPVKEDLLKVETISIFPLLQEMGIAINQLWIKLISIFENDIRIAINFLIDNAGGLRTEKNKVCIFTNIATDQNNNLKYFSTQYIPFETIEEIRRK